MEDQDRNQRNQSFNSNWEQNRNRRQDDQYNQQSNSNPGVNDLDGDGFIGHTGGFYGGTSYLGANYDDWNNNLGNSGDQYGNQNQQRNRSQQDSQRRNQYRDSEYYYNQDNPYGNSNYQQMSGNVRYGHGFESQQPNYGDRRNDDSYQNYNRRDENRGYMGAGNYNSNRDWSNRNRSEYNERDEWYGSPYGRRQTSYGNKGNWERSQNQSWNQHNDRGDDRNWFERAADKVSSWFSGDDDNQNRRDQREYMSGPHRGKGPKGYQRSAERIRDDVHDRLHDDPYVDASDIEVEVNNNEVILKGHVNTREAKRRAEDLVESVSGVRHVENRLRVGQPDSHFGSSGVYREGEDKNQKKGKGDTNRDITV